MGMGAHLGKMASTSEIPPKPALPIRPPNPRISPLLKAARWSALLLGVVYAVRRYRKIEKEEMSFIQPYGQQVKAQRHARTEAIRIARENAENADLAKECGIPVKSD